MSPTPLACGGAGTGARALPSCKSHWIRGRAPAPGWVLGQVLGGEGSGWGEHPVFGVEELPAERVGCGPITACPCTTTPCRRHRDEAGAEVHPGMGNWDGAVGLVSMR